MCCGPDMVVCLTAGCTFCIDYNARGTLETCRKSRMPLGLELSNVSRCVLFSTNSAMNLRIAVDTCSVTTTTFEDGQTNCSGSGSRQKLPANCWPSNMD